MDAAVLCPESVIVKSWKRAEYVAKVSKYVTSLVKCKPALLLRPSELRFEAKCPSSSFFEYRTIE